LSFPEINNEPFEPTPAPAPVTVTLASADNPVAIKVPVETLVAVAFARMEVPVALKVPVETLVTTILGTVAVVENKLAVEINPVLKREAVVIPALALTEPVLTLDAVIFVETIFGIVAVVAIKLPELVFDPTTFVAESNPEVTLVVATSVLEEILVAVTFCKLDNPVALIVPAEIFVFNIFVLVIFTVVKVPPTTKFPDKLKFAPVIVVAETVPALIFVATILLELKLIFDKLVFNNEPLVMDVDTILDTLTFVATKLPDDAFIL
jgi:hypothetical protein